jgi:plastocyanin domain-containing protein
MKFLRLLILALTAGVIFSSCQKELSAETGSAIGTLAKDAAGDCSPIGVSGAYKKDTTLNATHFVDVQLDVTNIGIYIVSTDTVNGYYFRATGVTPLPGANSIRLVGFGKPLAVGTDVFTVKFGGTTCEFNVNVTLGTGGGTTAVFTFPNGAACTGASQTPNFFVGIPTNAAINTMTIPVIVTQAGSYNFSTTSAGGLIFTGSGTLAIGNQSIILGANGTPSAPAGTINYTFNTTTPASSCGFDLTVQAAPTPAVYSFTCGSTTFAGTYQVGTAMTAGNTMTVPITVTTAGGYALTTTVNGVTFANVGILTLATTSITLIATGTPSPTAAPSTTFVLSGGGGANCNVTIPFTAAPTAAVYTFTCGAATFAGTYQVGTVMTAGNTITVPITVTTAGSYNITTNVNGVTFSGSGNLTATSTSITLTATGLPLAAAAPSTIFVLSGGGGANCSVTIPFTTGGGGATDFIQCQINGGAMTTFNVGADAEIQSILGFNTLTILGENVAGGADITFDIVSTSAIAAGSYNVNQGLPVVSGTYTDATGNVFEDATDGTTHSAPVFTVVITSITPTRITGTFSGRLYPTPPATGNKDITNGTFSLQLP